MKARNSRVIWNFAGGMPVNTCHKRNPVRELGPLILKEQ